MNKFDFGNIFLGFVCGVTMTCIVRAIWTEFWEEYEKRIERRARELASTKFAEFAGIKK